MGRQKTRRQVMKAGLASLVAPAIARAQGTRTLKFVPRTALASLDPVWTTDAATRAFALSVFESLYSVDEKLVPYPQMAAGRGKTDGIAKLFQMSFLSSSEPSVRDSSSGAPHSFQCIGCSRHLPY